MDQVNVHDLTEGLRDWRNIQDIVRLTFKALSETILVHEEAIKNLERIVDRKSDSEKVEAALTAKVSHSALDERLDEIFHALDRKASALEVSRLVDSRPTHSEMTSQLDTRTKQLEKLIGRAEENTDTAMGEVRSILSRKTDTDTLKSFRQSVIAALQRKASKSDVERLTEEKASKSEVNTALAGKSDVETLKMALESRPTKSDILKYVEERVDEMREELLQQTQHKLSDAIHEFKTDISKLTHVSSHSQLSEEVQSLAHSHSARLDAITTEIASLTHSSDFKHFVREIEDRVAKNHDETSQMVSQISKNVSTFSETTKDTLEMQKHNIGIFTKDIADKMRELREMCDSRISSQSSSYQHHVSRVVEQEKKDRDERLIKLEDQMKDMFKRVKDESQESVKEVRVECSRITDTHEETSVDTKNAIEALEQRLISIQKEQETSSSKILTAAKEVTSISSSITDFARVSDMCALLDMKSNVEDVNRALAEVSSELDTKATASEVKAALERQTCINNALSTEHAVGRWLWKSMRLKSTGAVPWNVQVANTNPENFRWEKDRSIIQIVASGLYEMSFGFFGKRRPTIQVLVNGEAVMSAVNATGKVVYHPSRGKSSGCVTGQNVREFIALPPNSKIQLIFANGDPASQGFLSLKKL
ncbi:hypothetical protein ADUPG1_008051 [Aduncisulcus paluster]|uniref:Uncharacterized protein n=1 Tax=Aduncisulcus paluster TaxID=2918883 RepID=A0ABQ5KQJ6_9EUKA|nr:hypothetical protein ADUPG1_008051 [Aduncisulcus paluster]